MSCVWNSGSCARAYSNILLFLFIRQQQHTYTIVVHCLMASMFSLSSLLAWAHSNCNLFCFLSVYLSAIARAIVFVVKMIHSLSICMAVSSIVVSNINNYIHISHTVVHSEKSTTHFVLARLKFAHHTLFDAHYIKPKKNKQKIATMILHELHFACSAYPGKQTHKQMHARSFAVYFSNYNQKN